MCYVIDRIEDGIAVCVSRDKEMPAIHLSLDVIAGSVREGVVIVPSGESKTWQVNEEQTAALRAETDARFQRLLKKQKDTRDKRE